MNSKHAYSKIRPHHLFLRFAVLALAGSTVVVTAQNRSPFYDFKVVAAVGQVDTAGRALHEIDRFPSVNDSGWVVFKGEIQDGGSVVRQNIYSVDPISGVVRPLLNTATTFELPKLLANEAPAQLFSAPVINNVGQVVAWRRLNAVVQVGFPFGQILNAPLTYVEVWSPTGNPTPGRLNMPIGTIASGDAGVGAAAGLLFWLNPISAGQLPSPYDPSSPWVAIQGTRNNAFPAVNNLGRAAYCALDDRNYLTSSGGGFGGPASSVPLTGDPRRPKIADDDTIICYLNESGVQEIASFSWLNFTPKTVVASTAAGFSSLDQSPNISDDGKVVVFSGNVAVANNPAFNTFGLGTGSGIFLAVDTGSGSRQLFRIAGDAGELGLDSSMMQNQFSSFDADSRLAVIHQNLGPAGLDGDSVVVSFIATPNAASPHSLFTAQKGIWTARGVIQVQGASTTVRRTGIFPVVQIGDDMGGSSVNDVSLHDSLAVVTLDDAGLPRTPIRGEHRIVFWVGTAAGSKVVRGLYLDSDEDCLPDHWERSGLTVGGVLVDLPAMGADPLHKDLFVHADWMLPTATYAFNHRAQRMIANAFMRAPLSNPSGLPGIHLHVDAGPNSLMDPAKNTTWGALSRAGSIPFQPVIGSLMAVPPFGPFDFDYDWSAVDTAKQSHFDGTMRHAVFHYVLFAHDHPGTGTLGESRGIPGRDVVITLGTAASKPGGTVMEEAGTFMHELGHNLGLRHGGDDHLPNFKPNFVSIMNYGYAFTGVHIDNGTSKGRFEWNYSTRKLPDLNENALTESVGIGDPDRHFAYWDGPCMSNPNYFRLLPYPAIDWDCSGNLTAGTVAADLNGDGAMTALTSFNDWPAVVFDGGGQIGAAAALTSQLVPSVNEPTYNEVVARIPRGLEDDEATAPVDEVVFSPAQGLPPLSVTFDGTASTDPDGTVVNWEWSFGDGTTNTGPVVTHVYSAPGTYFATLSVTDNQGNKNRIPIQHMVRVLDTFRLRAARLGGNAVEITVLGQPDVGYRLESSSDLNNWSFLTVLSSTNGISRFTNSNTSASSPRFFRAVVR